MGACEDGVGGVYGGGEGAGPRRTQGRGILFAQGYEEMSVITITPPVKTMDLTDISVWLTTHHTRDPSTLSRGPYHYRPYSYQ